MIEMQQALRPELGQAPAGNAAQLAAARPALADAVQEQDRRRAAARRPAIRRVDEGVAAALKADHRTRSSLTRAPDRAASATASPLRKAARIISASARTQWLSDGASGSSCDR